MCLAICLSLPAALKPCGSLTHFSRRINDPALAQVEVFML